MSTGFVYLGDNAVNKDDIRQSGARAATGMRHMGVNDGDSVALLLRNDIAYFEAITAGYVAGAYVVPINWHLRAEEVAAILKDCDAKVLVVHADLLADLAPHLPASITPLVVTTPPVIATAYELSPSRCAVPKDQIEWTGWYSAFSPLDTEAQPRSMIYTSGTTSQPKGVRRSGAAATSPEEAARTAERALRRFSLHPDCKAAMTGPMYHAATFGYSNLCFAMPSDIHLMVKFDAEELLRLIDTYKLTHMHMVPTMFARLLRLPQSRKQSYDIGSLISVTHGAAPCPLEIKRQMIDWWGPVISEYYGSTETTIVTVISADEWLTHEGSVGRPLPGLNITVRTDDGTPCTPGEIGEIFIELDRFSSFSYHGRAGGDGKDTGIGSFVSNGDVGHIDEDGYLYLSDRKKDMIISGGVNIFPVEIEDVISRHPDVRDCAVFGIPHSEYGETIAAAIELGAPITPGEIKAFIGEHLAKYKVPTVVTFHTSLPRDDSGKIYKRRLRDPYWEGMDRKI